MNVMLHYKENGLKHLNKHLLRNEMCTVYSLRLNAVCPRSLVLLTYTFTGAHFCSQCDLDWRRLSKRIQKGNFSLFFISS